MKSFLSVLISIVMTGIIGYCFTGMCMGAEEGIVESEIFTITDVRTLARNVRGNEITVIYAALDFSGQGSPPVLDLFYTIREAQEGSPGIESILFNVTPMFCMSSELYQDQEIKSGENHLYRAEIPPQEKGIIVEYFVLARIPGQKEMVFPKDAPLSLSGYTIQEDSRTASSR